MRVFVSPSKYDFSYGKSIQKSTALEEALFYGMTRRPKISLSLLPSLHTKNMCIPFVQYWTNGEDVGPTLYKYFTNVLCLLGYSIHQNVLFKKY